MSDTTPRKLKATFDGKPLTAESGQSIAAALIESGAQSWRTTKNGKPRGLFCGIGICFDCLVEIDGESGQRSCMIPVEEGMNICSAQGAKLPDISEHDA